MNVAQMDRLLKVINNDCQTRNAYARPDGRTCAIGAMMVDCGLPLPRPYSQVNRKRVNSLDDHILDTLQSVYGIHLNTLLHIQHYNDGFNTARERRFSITNYIEQLHLSE